jgi:hypothetical protein
VRELGPSRSGGGGGGGSGGGSPSVASSGAARGAVARIVALERELEAARQQTSHLEEELASMRRPKPRQGLARSAASTASGAGGGASAVGAQWSGGTAASRPMTVAAAARLAG